MSARGLRLVGALLVGLALLAACGSGGSNKTAPPCPPKESTRAAVNGAVTVCAHDIGYDVKTITTTAGPLAITLVNTGSTAHTFTMQDPSLNLKVSGHNDSTTGTVTLAKGTYTFKCTVDSHDSLGMHGKIVVS